MNLALRRASSPKALQSVLLVINKFSGLITPKSFYQVSDGHYYIIEDVDIKQPVGVIGYRVVNGWCVEQMNTVILPQFRGKGYGTEASNEMTKQLLNEYGKVFCTVNSENSTMIHIKRKQGFEEEGLLKDHFGKGRHIYIFSKRSIKNEIRNGKTSSM